MMLRSLCLSLLFVFSQIQFSAAVVGEIGPLEFDSDQRVDLIKHHDLAYRFEVYGNAEIHFRLNGQGSQVPGFLIEGPLENFGDDTELGAGPQVIQVSHPQSKNKIEANVLINAPGLYRVVIQSSTFKSGNTSQLVFNAHCLKGCSRPDVSIGELVQSYRELGKIQELLPQIPANASEHLDPRARFMSAFVKESENSHFSNYFPTMPISNIPYIREIMAGFKNLEKEVAPDLIVQGDLMENLGACNKPRVAPQPVSWLPEKIKYGHFPNLALTACQNAHSYSLSQVLTSLGVGNGSFITYHKKTLTTPAELIEELIQGGHTIEQFQERTYANFLSFSFDGTRDVRWPVWIDTGLKLGGIPLILPSGHSQHSWRISGPDVNTQIAFFMGTSGASFYPQTDKRPSWTGKRYFFSANSIQKKDLILKTFQGAAEYLKLNRDECAISAPGLPANGYGYLGICNDSDAFLEMYSRGTYSSYPLLRDKKLNNSSTRIGELLQKIPDDSLEMERKDVLRRVMNMMPHSLDSEFWFDENLRSQMKKIASELNK